MKYLKEILHVLVYIVLYSLTFYIAGCLLKLFYINSRYVYVISILAGILIYLFNRTIKPLLNHFTLPLTGLTFGLFYFVNNAIILKLVELILNQNVKFNNIVSLLIISFVMTIISFVIEEVFVKPFLKVINYE
jgi:uncharacterized membrane protein yvlD